MNDNTTKDDENKVMKTVEATRRMVETITGKTIELTNQEMLDMIKRISIETDAVFGRTIGEPKMVADQGVNGLAKIILLTGVMNDYSNQLKVSSALAMAQHATPEGLMHEAHRIMGEEINVA